MLTLSEGAELLTHVTGWLAAGFSLVAFTMRTMVPLRMAAILSNLFFIVWAALAGLIPPLVLHLVLLPFNIVRLAEILRMKRKLQDARTRSISAEMLLPFARRIAIPQGDRVFSRGDPADRIYFVLEGRVRIPEIGQELESGDLFGEIAFFTAERRRTASAEAQTPVVLLALSEDDLRKLYYQSPAFSFQLIELITRRLIANAGAALDGAAPPADASGPGNGAPKSLQVEVPPTSRPPSGERPRA